MDKIYNPNTPQWTFFAWASFISAAILMSVGVWHLPVEVWIKGYFAMGAFFLTGSTFTLSKTMRDNQEFADRNRRALGEDRPAPVVIGMKETG